MYKKKCELSKNHLVFNLFYFRLILAAVICLSVLPVSLYLTSYSSVKCQEEELIPTVLNYSVLSRLSQGTFPWAVCQQSRCYSSFDL